MGLEGGGSVVGVVVVALFTGAGVGVLMGHGDRLDLVLKFQWSFASLDFLA